MVVMVMAMMINIVGAGQEQRNVIHGENELNAATSRGREITWMMMIAMLTMKPMVFDDNS